MKLFYKQGSEIKHAARRRIQQLRSQREAWNQIHQHDRRALHNHRFAPINRNEREASALSQHLGWLEQEIRRLEQVVAAVEDTQVFQLRAYELLSYGFGIPLEEAGH